MIISSVILAGVKINNNMSKYEIEKKAYDLGMTYPEETKVIIDKEVKK